MISKQANLALMMCVTMMTCPVSEGQLYFKANRKPSTFETLISSLAEKAPSNAGRDLFRKLNHAKQWKTLNSSRLGLWLESFPQGDTLPPALESNSDGSEGVIQVLDPISAYNLLATLGASQNETEIGVQSTSADTSFQNEYDEYNFPTHTGVLDLDSLYLKEYNPKITPTYMEIPGMRLKLITPNKTPPTHTPHTQIGGDRGKKNASPTQSSIRTLTRNIFGGSVSPREFFKWNMQRMLKILYPYYRRPRFRYPYYDQHGNGKLLYGYGSDRLFKYKVFRPLRGYMR